MLKKLFTFYFVVGIILLCINISGFFIPLRSPDVYLLNANTSMGIEWTEQQVFEVIQNTSMERKLYITNVNTAIHKGMTNYWEDDGIDKYHLRVPIYENYILYFSSYIWPQNFEKYEFFMNYKKAIERGVGLCSQKSYILNDILTNNNISSYVIDMDGHVVLTALVDPKTNVWWVFDPDYGVVIQHNIGYIEKNPKIIRDYYSKEGYSNKEIGILEKIFGNTQINTIDLIESDKYNFEKISYFLIWIIPIFFMLPFMILYLYKKRKNL